MAWRNRNTGHVVAGGPTASHGGWTFHPARNQWCHRRGGSSTVSEFGCQAGGPGASVGGWVYSPDNAGYERIDSTANLSLGGILRGAGRIATGLIPGTLDDRIFDTLTSGGGGGRMPSDPCPGGFRIPGTSRCFEGPVTPRQNLPVPSPGLPVSGRPVGGGSLAESLGAQAPEIVQQSRARCPKGFVLAIDDNCYHKRLLPKKYRKWRPAPKAPVTAADAKAIRTAERAKTRVKKLAHDVGFTTKRRK